MPQPEHEGCVPIHSSTQGRNSSVQRLWPWIVPGTKQPLPKGTDSLRNPTSLLQVYCISLSSQPTSSPCFHRGSLHLTFPSKACYPNNVQNTHNSKLPLKLRLPLTACGFMLCDLSTKCAFEADLSQVEAGMHLSSWGCSRESKNLLLNSSPLGRLGFRA